MTDQEAKFIGTVQVRSWNHDGSKDYPRTAGAGEIQHPGTMNMCCHCACHGQRFNFSEKGRDVWWYCDRWVEARNIVQPVALIAPDGKTLESCHWYMATKRITRRTPETDGRKQVLNPDWDGPAE